MNVRSLDSVYKTIAFWQKRLHDRMQNELSFGNIYMLLIDLRGIYLKDHLNELSRIRIYIS